MPLKVIDLFCGCGGFSLGFDYLDEYFELVYALDNWEIACQSYKANFPYVDVDCRDALEVKPSEIPNADVVIGGPPCQEFSVAKAHHSKPEHKPSYDTTLVEWFLKVIEHLKPKFWIMENVPSVLKFIDVSNVKAKIYRMCDYGIPQIRKRAFIGIYHEPEKAPCKIVFPAVIASEYKGGYTYRKGNLGIKLSSVFRRRCLIAEAKLVQTFPLDFVVLGSLKDQYTQIGNAVPPLMAYRLAKALIFPKEKTLLEVAPKNA